jgi:hypothetical protein
MTALHLLVSVIIGAAIVAQIRIVRARSERLAAVIAAGVLIRAFTGLALFWISFLNAPMASTLNAGDGFWRLAIDAKGYYSAAVAAVKYGLITVLDGSASPAYVRALALWMDAVGVSPAAALYMNIFMYVSAATSMALLSVRRERHYTSTAALAALSAYTFSPALVIHSTQPLKDAFFASLLVFASVAAWMILQPIVDDDQRWWRPLAPFWLLAGSLYLIAGVRFYFGFVVWTAFGLAAVVAAVRRSYARLQHAVLTAAMTVALLYVISVGAGPYFWGSVRQILGPDQRESGTVVGRAKTALDVARRGFAMTPGGTNAAQVATPEMQTTAARSSDPGKTNTVSWSLGEGLVLMFMPVFVARAAGLITISGGSGLLFASDVDTLFLDVTVIAVILLLYVHRRQAWRHRAFLAFALGIGACSLVLLAYIVTNLGALLRLRLMWAVPVWTAALAATDDHATDGRDVPAAAEALLERRSRAPSACAE